MNPVLKITDGTQAGTVSLLDIIGWSLQDWNPSIPEPKGGGVFRDSPLVDGRRLAYRKLDNITDTFNLVGAKDCQDEMIASIRKLQEILEKAVSYWTSNWQNEPVWIEVKASKEKFPRYAVIVDYRLTGFGDFFQQPFFSRQNSATEATLIIEHGIWQDTIPGEEGNCVALDNLTDYVAIAEYTSKSYTPNVATDDETYSPYSEKCDQTDTQLYVGHAVYASSEAGIIFKNVDMPAGATLTRAILKLGTPIFISAEALDMKVEGQYQGYGGINSVTLISGGHSYVNALVQIMDKTGTGANVQAIVMNGVVVDLNIISPGEGYTNPIMFIIDEMWPDIGGVGASGTCTASSMNVDALTFTGTNDDFLNRERTHEYTVVVCQEDVIIPTEIDVTEIVNAIMSNPNWTVGDNIGIFLSEFYHWGTGRAILSFETPLATKPELILTWFEMVSPIGQSKTCAPEVYICNNHSTSKVNFIYCYDESAPPGNHYSPNMYGWDYSSNMPLFQSNAGVVITPAVGDILYFCSCPLDANDKEHGPFFNLVLDLYSHMTGVEGVWECYISAAWEELEMSDPLYLDLCGDQSMFQKTGIGSVVWKPDINWGVFTVPDGIDNKTGYCLRFRVTSVDSPVSPYQQHRDIYTAIKPYINIDSEYIPGDLPALARIIFQSAACWQHSMNTMVMGLRSISRGANFDAFLNVNDEQLSRAISFTYDDVLSDLTTCGDAPTGKYLNLSDMVTINTWTEVCHWKISGSFANEYIGIFHAYLRMTPGTNSVGHTKFRLKAVYGEQFNVSYSDINCPVLASAAFYVGISMDLGQLNIQPSNLHPNDMIDQLTIYLETESDDDNTYLNCRIFDIVLMPSDEWSGCFGMPRLTGTAVLEYGLELDVDGITVPRNYRAIENALGSRQSKHITMLADWSRIASGEPIFQANKDQRLWFLQYKQGNDKFFNFHLCGAVRAERSARYILARGAG